MSARARRLLPIAVFACALVLALFASAVTGPAFEELPRFRAVERCEEVVRALAARGPAALANAEARAAYASFDGRGTLLVLLGAWSKLSIGRLGVLDALTAARLPWLVLSALGATALAALLRPVLGVVTAIGSALLLLLVPRWLHGLAVTSDGVVVASVWLIVLAAYQRSIAASRRRACWAAAGAAAMGLGASLSLASLWVLPLVALHYLVARPGEARRSLARGRVPVPALVLLALPIAPVVLYLANPALWGGSGITIVRWVLSPLAPSVARTEYAGRTISALPVPGGYASSWLVQTLPLALGVASLAGVAIVAHRALARHFASGNLRPGPDRRALGALLVLGGGSALIGPALAPDALTTFPPRVELSLPFVAALAALALARVLEAAPRPLVGRLLAGAVVASLAWLALRAPATSSAFFDPLLGGTRRVVASRSLPAVDGSELAALAPAIDRQGRTEIALHAPGVPPELWDVLRKAGRLRTFVVTVPARGTGSFTLGRGAIPGEAVAVVERGGARLWTLAR